MRPYARTLGLVTTLAAAFGAAAPALAEPPTPAPARPDEPAVCLISMLGRRNGKWDADIPTITQREAGFRSFRILTVESHDPLNCDVFLELNQKGISSLGPAEAKAYAARGGELLWQSSTETSDAYTWGSCKLGADLREQLQPGASVRRKLDALRDGPAPTPELVEKLAGPGLLKNKQLDGSERDLMAASIPPSRGETAASSAPAAAALDATRSEAPAAGLPAAPAAPIELAEGPRAGALRKHAKIHLTLAQAERELLP